MNYYDPHHSIKILDDYFRYCENREVTHAWDCLRKSFQKEVPVEETKTQIANKMGRYDIALGRIPRKKPFKFDVNALNKINKDFAIIG